MNKIFETIAVEYPLQNTLPPPVAYDPCPEYGLRFPGGAEDLAVAQTIMMTSIRSYFPDAPEAKIRVFGETLPDTGPECAQMRTTRTCYFERSLPAFVRVPLGGQ